jgi:hypothetical protein
MRQLGKREQLIIRLFPEIKKRLAFVAEQKGLTVTDYVTRLIGKETAKNEAVKLQMGFGADKSKELQHIIVPAAKKVVARIEKSGVRRTTTR